MSPLDPWRQLLRPLIPRGFLRRDMDGAALFASDYPRFPGAEAVSRAIERAGFDVRVEKGLAHLLPREETCRALLAALPCPAPKPRDENLYALSLARRLQNASAAPQTLPIPILCRWIKALDAGDAAVYAEIGAYCALCQRQKQPLPAWAEKLILCALNDDEGGAPAC